MAIFSRILPGELSMDKDYVACGGSAYVHEGSHLHPNGRVVKVWIGFTTLFGSASFPAGGDQEVLLRILSA